MREEFEMPQSGRFTELEWNFAFFFINWSRTFFNVEIYFLILYFTDNTFHKYVLEFFFDTYYELFLPSDRNHYFLWIVDNCVDCLNILFFG